MNTIGERLMYLIETKEINMSEFCRKYNLNYVSIERITKDKRPLGINIIKDLMVVFPNLNINWLVFGTGNINYSKNDVMQENMLQEPHEDYNVDLVEKVFLKYLNNEKIINRIKEIHTSEK